MCLQHEQTVLQCGQADRQWSFAPQDRQGPGGRGFCVGHFGGVLTILTGFGASTVISFASFPAASIFCAMVVQSNVFPGKELTGYAFVM